MGTPSGLIGVALPKAGTWNRVKASKSRLSSAKMWLGEAPLVIGLMLLGNPYPTSTHWLTSFPVAFRSSDVRGHTPFGPILFQHLGICGPIRRRNRKTGPQDHAKHRGVRWLATSMNHWRLRHEPNARPAAKTGFSFIPCPVGFAAARFRAHSRT